MQLNTSLEKLVQVSKHFSTSEKTFNNSKWDHVQRERGGFTESDSVVTLSEAVIKKYSSTSRTPPQIRYEMDEESKRIVANVVDPESGKVVRKIPNEETQQLAKRIGKFLKDFFDLT